MKKIILIAIGFVFILVLPEDGRAAATKLAMPYVEKGQAKIEWQGYYLSDDDGEKNDAWRQKLIVAYGVTDYWKTQIRTAYEHGGGAGDADFKTVGFDNTFQLTEKGEYFIDVGTRLDYEHTFDPGDADSVAVRLLLAKDTEDFLSLFNFKVSHDIGESGQDFTGSVAFGTKYKYKKELQPGIEVYNEFGSLEHTDDFRFQNRSIGPVISGRAGSFGYQAGYLFGISDTAPDGIFKLSLEYEF